MPECTQARCLGGRGRSLRKGGGGEGGGSSRMRGKGAGAVAGADAVDAAEACAVAREVRERGYGIVRGALGPATVAALARSVAAELASPRVPQESGTPRVRLEDASTWPRGRGRRVVEVAPPTISRDATAATAAGCCWASVCESQPLRRALDALLGEGRWTIPLNGPPPAEGAAYVRHWYSPVVFPEGEEKESHGTKAGGRAAGQALAAPGHDGCGPAWGKDEDERLAEAVSRGEGWSAVAVAVGNGRTKRMCRERWCPPWTDAEDARLRECVAALGGQHAPNKLASAFQRHSTRTTRQILLRAAHLTALDAAEAEAATADHQTAGARGVTSAGAVATRTDSGGADARGVGKGAPASRAEACWTAVNRRRVEHRGWHVDIGPGFDTSARRTSAGHRYQGAVLLLLLSDWAPGEGGTAVVARSHEWVAARLCEEGPAGVAHDQLSVWAQERTLRGIVDGSLRYARAADGSSGCAGEQRIEQIVGCAGDVAILHPLAVHSGTKNLGEMPRLMANGMVRITEEAFDRHGHPLFESAGVAGAVADEGGAVTGTGGATHASDGMVMQAVQPRSTDVAPLCARAEAERRVIGALARAISALPDELPARPPADATLPFVSVILPVHNASQWLDECLMSLLTQTYEGPIELSAYDDASTDDSRAILERWAEHLRARGIGAVVSGSETTSAGANRGCGFAKNRCVENASGTLLCFLDADDVMMPGRIAAQEQAARAHPRALLGCAWQRMPLDATEHYSRWANTLSGEQMLLQQFRETTVQMPTWFMSRTTFDATGPFIEDGLQESLAEDLEWFLRHLGSFDGENGAPSSARAVALVPRDGGHSGEVAVPADASHADDVALVRVGDTSSPLLLYRWTPSQTSSRTSRQRLFAVRAAALERRVLSRPAWREDGGFVIWGNGRDGRQLFGALSPEARGRVRAFVDIAPNRIGTTVRLVHFHWLLAEACPVRPRVRPATRRVSCGQLALT